MPLPIYFDDCLVGDRCVKLLLFQTDRGHGWVGKEGIHVLKIKRWSFGAHSNQVLRLLSLSKVHW